MVDIDIAYVGELHCTAVHRPSRSTIETDAPVDNHGRGEAFSPTDLVAAALGTCMVTTMAIRTREQALPLEGTRVHVEKVMTREGPRRIQRLTTRISVPNAARLDAAARALLENIAHTCPVRLSLAESIEVPVVFEWQ